MKQKFFLSILLLVLFAGVYSVEVQAQPPQPIANDFITGGGWINSPEGAIEGPEVIDYQWNQDFSTDVEGWIDADSGWYGSITWQSDETALVEGYYGPFSRFDGYGDTWPGKTWYAEIDIYLDPADLDLGEGFDYSVAASKSDGDHLRDFVFHVTKDTSTGKLLIAGSNNTNWAPREGLENIENHYEITEAGWYTFQHKFYDAGGYLAVDLNLINSSGSILFKEIRENTSDTIPGVVGENLYAWFTFIDVETGLKIDNHQRYYLVKSVPTGEANFGFVAKYNEGMDLPVGNVQFTFESADLNFNSTTYDGLVVNADEYLAEFEGTGTINGEGDYGFTVWTYDGDPNVEKDTFRIKIWDSVTDEVIYDNGYQEISGGNIELHISKK